MDKNEKIETLTIENKTFSQERALYNTHNANITSCNFAGEEDGESALKESGNLVIHNCNFLLRYPLWHVNGAIMTNCMMADTCRAAIWYSKDVVMLESKLNGIKAIRECNNVKISNSEIVSPEFGWRSKKVYLDNCSLTSEYAFLSSENIDIFKVKFSGKYSFQYTKNVTITNSELDTKDAFWHSKNVTVKNCTINGEYLGWYSEGLTLIGCHIKGTQPLCYCKKLRIINCTFENCDLAFEYSEVNATISGEIISIKNPLKGTIVCDRVQEVIVTPDSVYVPKANIIMRHEQTLEELLASNKKK